MRPVHGGSRAATRLVCSGGARRWVREATAAFTRLGDGVLVRTDAFPAGLAAPAPPATVPAAAAGADPLAAPVADPAVQDQMAVLDQVAVLEQVRAGLVAEARSWAARVRALRRWQQLPHAGGERFDQLEMAGSWQIGQQTATRWTDDADRLALCLPRTLAALEAGALLVHQASVLLHRTRHCSPQVARAVDAEIVPIAGTLCPADLRKRVDHSVLRLEAELEPDATEQRHADAAADRRTFTRAEPDGMGLAGAVLTAAQMQAWQDGLDQLERGERRADRDAGIDRSCDQRRADLFAALPAMVLAGLAQDQATDTTGQPRRPWTLGPEQLAAHVVLNVHVPVATVLGLSEHPGSLDRYGPISASRARLVRPSSLRRILVDASSGRPVAVDDRPTPVGDALRQQLLDLLAPIVITDPDEPQHDPSARLGRLVDVRDVHCCGPGCSTSRCDRDHLQPYPDGPTSATDLGLLSPRCHRAKHHGWTLTRHPDGSTTRTSPLHRTYHRPPPHRPPPAADLHGEPPPRPRRTGRPTLSGPAPEPRPTAAKPPAPPPAPDPDEDDEPPF